MPPKKREREEDSNTKNPLYEQMQADHELFLQAFEKPTQIYRFLRTRNLVSPIFLERTLTYMKHRMSRNHKTRTNFKVDTILGKLLSKNVESYSEDFTGFMTLIFTGFFDRSEILQNSNSDQVSVETILLKICHKKRKDVSSPVMQTSVGRSEVPRNPDPLNPPSEVTAISVPSDSFNLTNGHLVKSYVLLLRVSINANKPYINGICNGDLSDSGSEEPPKKTRKNGKILTEEIKVYGAELIVYDKHNRCLLTNGEYELVLQEIITSKGSPRKLCSWETFSSENKDKPIGPFAVFNKGPVLKFHLQWNDHPTNGSVAPPPSLITNLSLSSNHVDNHIINRPHKQTEKSVKESLEKKKTRIFYQFLYNNNTRQQTEARDDLHCPWCSVNCLHLYCLLKHLKLCHSRFIFTYVPHPKGARVDVAINECYDGSYSGNPHDLHSQPPGFAFSRNGPVRRTPVTNVMVCRPKRLPPNLSEFFEPDESEYDGPRPYITGHNRLYHHTGTCHPIRPQEIEYDSEGENDPEWLQTKTKLMIDEFTDVNEGEKELMKMWNLHVMKFGFVGDCQIPLACVMFVENHGREILRRRMYKNFVLHMCSMFDFGLIGAAVVVKTVSKLQALSSNEQRDIHRQTRDPMTAEKPLS